jgi:hypothetical protein
MPLTDTFVRQVKPSKPSGDKHADDGGMYLLVKPTGFPSIRTFEHCMSENTINGALRGMGYSKEVMTAHGFRATARTILDEILGERVDLMEHQRRMRSRIPMDGPTIARRTYLLAGT